LAAIEAALRGEALPAAAPDGSSAWLTKGTSDALTNGRPLIEGDGSDPIAPKPKRRIGESSATRRRAPEIKRSRPLPDLDGESDAARLLAFGGPALIAAFGLLLLFL